MDGEIAKFYFCTGADSLTGENSRGEGGSGRRSPHGTQIFAFLPYMGVRFVANSCMCPPHGRILYSPLLLETADQQIPVSSHNNFLRASLPTR